MLPDYYAILEVARDASQQQIRTAFKRLALQWHPDRSPDPSAAARFQALREAYDVLGSPERRAAYDGMGSRPAPPSRAKPKSATRAGFTALTWVEEFFIQAGGIEAEGPGKGSLRRFTADDLDQIWQAIAGRLLAYGEVRQCMQRLELVLHYVARHPELNLPELAHERVTEKRRRLDELEALRKGSRFAWSDVPPTMTALLRRHRFEEARSLLLWRAAHDQAERLAGAHLFDPAPPVEAPARELAMVDRLEAVAQGEPADRRLGHGYVACRRCGGWALDWGVGVPRCANCGSRRWRLRPRDERDEWLAQLIVRVAPAFWAQANRRRAAAQQGLERWVFTPLFLGVLLIGLPVFTAAESGLAAWSGVMLFGIAWWSGAWSAPDVLPADVELAFADEWRWSQRIAVAFNGSSVALLVVLGVAALVGEDWAQGLAMGAGVAAAMARRVRGW